MQGPSNRSVVIISGLLTPLVLGGATLAVAFRMAGCMSPRRPRARIP